MTILTSMIEMDCRSDLNMKFHGHNLLFIANSQRRTFTLITAETNVEVKTSGLHKRHSQTLWHSS